MINRTRDASKADAEEIQEASDAAREGTCKELAILHFVKTDPAQPEGYNLRAIPNMIERVGLVTGLSDQTLDNTTAITSLALGASSIENHFIPDRSGCGPDDSFSLGLAELAILCLCRDNKTAWTALGKVDYGRKSSEQGNVKFRRSLSLVKDLKAGNVITADAVRSVRPGFGLEPKYLNVIVGEKLKIPVFRNTLVTREAICRESYVFSSKASCRSTLQPAQEG